MHRFLLSSVVLIASLFAATAPAQDVEREFKECPECPVMLGIPAGSFTMGSPANEPGRYDTEGPQHAVTVKAFALGKYNVTVEEFLLFLKQTGYRPEPCNPILNLGWKSPGAGLAYPPFIGQPARWPAACLDWRDAQAYVEWLNKKVRETRPELGNREGPYRLPSEAEWEFAARGGTTTARWWGVDIGAGRANCNGCGSPYDYKVLSEVDAFDPNPFGLFGVLGNVWQWTEDCWHESYAGAPTDGNTSRGQTPSSRPGTRPQGGSSSAMR